jgi:hypothetical protein
MRSFLSLSRLNASLWEAMGVIEQSAREQERLTQALYERPSSRSETSPVTDDQLLMDAAQEE